jgi:DNA-binding CsgD family transcriptional regulator
MARGDQAGAAAAGRSAFRALQESGNEDLLLDIRLPAAEGLLGAGTDQERGMVMGELRLTLSLLVPRFTDDNLRVRWLRGPLGRELTRLAGPPGPPPATAQAREALQENETALLKLLVEGKSNRQIAEDTGVPADLVARRLAELYAKLGASSRADATSIALMGRLV